MDATDQTEEFYGTLDECLDRMDLGMITGQLRAIAKRLRLQDTLKAQGFRQFSVTVNVNKEKPLPRFESANNASIVLRIGNDMRLRIAPKGDGLSGEQPRIKDIRFAQAIVSGSIRQMDYEILPVIRGEVNQQEYAATLDALRGAGYSIFGHNGNAGLHKDDVRKIPNGPPLALDRGIIKGARDGSKPAFDPVRDAAWVEPAPAGVKSMFEELPAGLRAVQEAHFPAIVDKRPRGVLTDEDRHMLLQGKLDIVRGRKPECFILLDRSKLTPEQQKLTVTEEGQRQFYRRNSREFFHVTETMLPDFIRKVFDQGLYPEQAMQQLIQQQKETVVTGSVSTRVSHVQVAPERVHAAPLEAGSGKLH